MNINDKVDVKIEVGTLAVLVSGLYISNTGIGMEAIPTSMFIELAEKLAEHLPNWDYDVLTLEDWIFNNLIIAPKVLFSDEELEHYKDHNHLFIERKLGNVELVATAVMGEDVSV